MRRIFLFISITLIIVEVWFYFSFPVLLWSLVLVGPFLLLGFQDYFQKKSTIRRNFPILGRFRYLFESIRPEINQYFVESNTDGKPFSREKRSVVYQRSKLQLDTLPFGTQRDVYASGYEWVNHSLAPQHLDPEHLRITIGGPRCTQPYTASILNISAMSFGAISKNAIMALSGGAKDGHFALNTGEGGITKYHLEPGADIIWQIGTGYFGCRREDGTFCETTFARKATHHNVKMIELKLSQGAKPGHGGILPGRKVDLEISQIRDVPLGKPVISPPAHSTFSTPVQMMQFIQKLRELSGGKPVGIKLCLG
ncbi:MAG: FMN-binding glutamate synthase family protein, partial [Deltaproteobacteria bacterium CG_4_10_14_0_2_um_filter_43_8]